MDGIYGKKFISPQAWFSLIYPSEWGEFEDTESSFLFYNPDKWSGNFRISAFKKDAKFPDAKYYGKDSVKKELAANSSASLIKVGGLECAYSKEMFQEEGEYYVSHIWITGINNVALECSFTVPRGGSIEEAEKIIESIEVREDGRKYPAEIIPIRVSEINEVNEGYEWAVSTVKKLLKKDFQGIEEDLVKLQQVMEKGSFGPKQKDAWIAFGITACVILSNEIDGMKWMTLIDGNREAPVLQYGDTDTIIDPLRMVWSKVKAGQICNIIDEYKSVIESL